MWIFLNRRFANGTNSKRRHSDHRVRFGHNKLHLGFARANWTGSRTSVNKIINSKLKSPPAMIRNKSEIKSPNDKTDSCLIKFFIIITNIWKIASWCLFIFLLFRSFDRKYLVEFKNRKFELSRRFFMRMKVFVFCLTAAVLTEPRKSFCLMRLISLGRRRGSSLRML